MSRSASSILAETAHRPWSLPKHPAGVPRPWVMAQSWSQLLFAHWRVELDVLRKLIPAGLEIDRYGGEAWIGVVPFTMRDVHPRGLLSVPRLSHFPELNVRTYVTRGGKPGVWFFSLDATSPLAVWGARRFFHLPYFNAEMQSVQDDDWVRYASRRTDGRGMAAEFEARYRPDSAVFRALPDSREAWLTERYCLYTVDAAGRLWRCEVHHPQWSLQRAHAEMSANTMAGAVGMSLEGDPLLHYSERIDVLTWLPERVEG